MKKKVDELTQAKRIYSGELLAFAVVFAVIGALIISNVIAVMDWKKWAFTVLTLLGGIWAVIDFAWTYRSEKRRKKNSLLDKALLLPNGVALIVLDIIALANLIQNPDWIGWSDVNFFQIEIGIAILYVAIIYAFEGVYHYYHIHPMVYEIMEEEKEKNKEDMGEENGQHQENS